MFSFLFLSVGGREVARASEFVGKQKTNPTLPENQSQNQETKHRGEEVVIIFPDAALAGAFQAAVAGEDLRISESLAPPPGGAARLRLAPSTSPGSQQQQGSNSNSSNS